MDGLPEKLLIDTAIGHRFASMSVAQQQTLASPIHCVGIGLHSGQRTALSLHPAPAGSGIVFRRTDLGIDIPARFDRVNETRLCTVIGEPGAQVSTIEHLMAALAGAGIDNALIEVDGPEVPILDGSADGFVFLIDCAGRTTQAAVRRRLEVLHPVRVEDGEAFAELRPNDSDSLEIALSIAFAAPAIGRQALSLTMGDDVFRSELARARTFTQADEVAAAQAAGLARGGSLDNAIVVDGERVLNPGGLRMADEFVRHKILDAFGDLALAGAPISGRLVAHKSGHRLNNRLLRALFADLSAWRLGIPGDTAGWLSAA
jgi:UDP-3-O-[3-hydroxymyristoyl] N-acetylglucosamine deacetylase